MAQIGKTYSGELYKVVSIDGHSGLCTTPDDEKSVETCRAAIDRRNERTQTPGTSEKHFNLKPEAFLIIRTKWNREYFADGAFKAYRENTETVEVYPPELYNRKPDVNEAVSEALKRETLVVVYAGKINVAFTDETAHIVAHLKIAPTGKCTVWLYDAEPDGMKDAVLLGCYNSRLGAMRAIGRYYGTGNYKFVRQYSEKEATK